MDEMTWLNATTERTWMLEHVRATTSWRQLRLFGCACVRRVWPLLPVPARQVIEDVEQALDWQHSLLAVTALVEQAAETLATVDLSRAVRAARCVVDPEPRTAVHAATHALAAMPRDAWRDELAAQCELVRCLFGNPYRPSHLDPAWRDYGGGAVRNLARVIRHEGRVADLPILADALEDAGCTDEQLLGHCRHPGPHARGCWAVNLILDAP
jgi:hypothetical protein